MRWFGHVVRMPENTPVQKALTYAQEHYNRPRGKPKDMAIINEEATSRRT